MLPTFLTKFVHNSVAGFVHDGIKGSGPDISLPDTAPDPIFACPSGHMFDRAADMKATLRSFS